MADETSHAPGVTPAALLVVDVQNDFCEGGALAVPNAGQALDALNGYLDEAVRQGMTIYASRDWHPPTTRHFKAYGGEWPVHCVQGTPGARFHEALRLPAATVVVTKGEQADRPGYSAFEGHTPEGRPLLEDLKGRGVHRLYVAGLATDYCVRASVVDALAAGLQVTVLEDAIAGVDLHPGDSARALDEMRAGGAVLARGFQERLQA
jgi:nicotinamidase/pyrazinamidase